MERSVKKYNAITEARYEMSPLEKNIVYFLMAELAEDDPLEKEYVVPVAYLRSKHKSVTVNDLEKASEKLLRRVYHIIQDNGNLLLTSLVGVVRYDTESDSLVIKISQKILPYFISLKKRHTTIFQLDTALSLRSVYAKLPPAAAQKARTEGQMDHLVSKMEGIEALFDVLDPYLRPEQQP